MVKRDASEAVKHDFCGKKRRWASFVNPNILALSIGLLFAQPAFAEHINWADWTTSETGDPGSASGDVCGVDIQYSGNLVFAASGYWTEGSPPPYTGNSVVSNAPTGAVLASDLAGSRTITFSREVQDPIIAILSMGRPSQPVSYSFNAPFTVLSEGRGAYGDGWYEGALTGYEFHGVIQFSGKFTSIQWGSSPGEYWHGVTVGIPDSKCCGLKEIQQTPPDSNGNITVSAVTENPSGASVYWKIEPDATKGNTDIICADISPEQGSTATITPRAGADCDMKVTAWTSGNCKKEADIRISGKCEECKGGGDCKAAGGGEPDLGSILVNINAGRTAEGRSAGSLILHTETPSPDNATPKPLKFNTSNSDSEVIEKDGALRQIVAPEAFIDIVTESAYAYNVNFYLRDEMGTKTNGLYAIATGAEPYATWRIENPDASATDYDRLKVSKTTGSSTKTYEYQWDEASKTWTLNKGGLQTLGKKTEITSDGKVITETIADSARLVVEKTVKTYKNYAWGSELVKSVINPDRAFLTAPRTDTDEDDGRAVVKIVADPNQKVETRTYYDVTGENGYGHLKMIVNPDGSWERYTYDAQGRKTAEISPWLDAAANSSESASRVVYYDYTIQDPSDANLAEDKVRPRLVTEKILGQVVKKTFYVYKVDSATKERTEIMKQAAIPTATYADPANLTTTTVSYPFASGTAQSGKTKSITKPDGTMETYTHEYGQYASPSTIGQPGAFTPGTGKAIRTTVTQGTLTKPQGVANKTTREISVTDEFGYQVLRETQVYTGSVYERIGYEVSLYDERGRLSKTYYPDGTYKEIESDCCNKIKEVERDGTTTRYTEYDALGRLKTMVKEGSANTSSVSTTFAYDAAGRQLSQTESGGSLKLTSSSKYDSAGRLTSRIDPSGLTTSYSYSADGRTETVTLPGGATRITSRYLDGRTKSITGTAGTDSYYTYGTNSDGSQWTKIDYFLPTGSSGLWERTTTDMLDHKIKTEHPGGQGTEIVASYYDNKGRLIKTTTPGQAATLYQYDELGNPTAIALDVNNNNQIDLAGSDRISAVDSIYKRIGNDWWQEKIQKTYATISNGTATTVSTSRKRLTGLGSNGLTAESVSIDIHGNQTAQRTYVNRAAKQVKSSIDYPDATNDAGTLKENGLVIAERDKNGLEYRFSYDALGRRTGVTDPRTGTTVTHYNNKGQVDYITDPAGNKTSYTYEPTTGRKSTETDAKNRTTYFSYTPKGQLWRTWGGAAYPVEYGYDNFGRKTKMSTYRSTSTKWDSSTWPANPGTSDNTFWNYLSVTNLVISKIYSDGKYVSYNYSTGGLLKTRNWARKNGTADLSTTYTYDPATGELTKVDYSDATPDVTFTYDRLGRKKEVTDAVGKHNFAYNDKLQLATETISGLYSRTITRSYSQLGMLGRDVGLSLGTNYGVGYGYEDATGRLNSVSWKAAGNAPQTATYAYLANSDLPKSLTLGKRQTIYGYEPKRDLLNLVQNNFNGTSISRYDYIYDNTGLRTRVINSGREFPRLIDPFAEASDYSPGGFGPEGGFNLYGYNTRNELSESRRYQGIYPVDTTQPLEEQYRSYKYDPIGNRTNSTEGSTPYTYTYTANNVNQYSAVKNGNNSSPLTYDYDGNLTEYSGWTITYDAENRLVAAAPKAPANGSKAANFLYDYLGRRVQKTVYTYSMSKKTYQQSSQTMFVYDGWNLLEEIAANQPSVFYVWGLDFSGSLKGAGGVGGLLAVARNFSIYDYNKDGKVDSADLKVLAKNQGGNEKDLAAIIDGISHTHLYLYDANGNVGQEIDATTGVLKAKYEYDPFGNPISSAGVYSALNPFRFSTKYTDNETGLVYYGYRYYLPSLGRWINRDPIGERGGMNLYGFIDNDAINKFDVLGLSYLILENINCIGYASGYNLSLQPMENSLAEVLKDWKCSEVKNGGKECKPCEKGEKVMMVYIYAQRKNDDNTPIDWRKTIKEQRAEGRKTANDFWTAKNTWGSSRKVDYHAIKYNPIKGQSGDWDFVGHHQPMDPPGTHTGPDAREGGRFKIERRLNNPEDYWELPERILGRYCCKQCASCGNSPIAYARMNN